MPSRPDVVAVLTYYAPYVSGLSATARDVAEGLAARGWSVRVVTSQHDPALPLEENLNGVHVIRCPAVAMLTKGIVCPSFVPRAVHELRKAAVGHLHVPLLEAGAIATLVRSTPLLTTYYCDIALPPSHLNRAAMAAVFASARQAIRRSRSVVVLSDDYARSSRLWNLLKNRQMVAIPPPCRDRSGGEPVFRDGPGPHIGFLGRIVEEKGLENLIEAVVKIDRDDLRLLIGGDYNGVAGGSVIGHLQKVAGDDDRVRFLGFLPEESLADFYASLDCFAFPSVNSFEAFGIVQIEAMSAGVPVVASDRPGVRVPVAETGFGVLVPQGDPSALRQGIVEVLEAPPSAVEGQRRTMQRFGTDAVVQTYERALLSLQR
jgi:glycosyltransferase involved in cell wall biosynthesis